MQKENLFCRPLKYDDNILRVYLHLPGKKYKPYRKLGEINKKKKTFYSVPKFSDKHLMECNNSIGICYRLTWQYEKFIKYICIMYDDKKLWTTLKRLKKYGTFLHFKSNDLEKQIFLNLSKFSKSKKELKRRIYNGN